MYSVFARPKVTGTGLLLGGYKMAKKMMVKEKDKQIWEMGEPYFYRIKGQIPDFYRYEMENNH